MRIRAFTILFISCVTFCVPASAEIVSQDITVDTIWEVNSPYTLACDVNICAGVTLTIKSGIDVNSIDCNSLEVYGTIEANEATFTDCPMHLHETGRVILKECNFGGGDCVEIDVNGLLTAYDSNFADANINVYEKGMSHLEGCDFTGSLYVEGKLTADGVNFTDTDVNVVEGGHVYLNGGCFAESSGQAQIDASGTFTAYDTNFVDADVNAYADASFDLIGCDFDESTVGLRAGSMARVKYCCGPNSVFYIDCDAHILITSNDFSTTTRIEATGNDSNATINLEFNYWREDPDYNDPAYLNWVSQIIKDHNNYPNLPYIDFKPVLQIAPPQGQEDTGGELQGRVFFYFDGEAHPLPFAAVAVEGAEQPAWVADNEGKFGFSGVDPGQRKITVWHSYYYTVSKKVLIGEKSTTFLYVVMTPRIGVDVSKFPLGGGAITVDSNNPAGPNVVEIRSRHFGPYRHTYYLDGVRTEETVTATIDWGSATNDASNREVRWYANDSCFHITIPVDTNSITYESYTFDLADELWTGQELKVEAVDTNTGSFSSRETAEFAVIDPPNGVPTVLLKADTSKKVISYRILGSDNWALNGLLRAVDILGGIPGFGGHPVELAARAYAIGEIRGDGTASATFLDEHSFYPMEIDGIEVAPSASIVLGWDYNDTCNQWDPWGKLGIEVEGSYTSDPSYTIVMVGPVPVPVYWRTALRLALSERWFTLTGWKYVPTIPDIPIPKWKASESFIFEVLAELMLGVGVADHLAVEGFFGGGPQMHICNKDNFDDLQLRALYLKLYGGIRVVVFIFKYEKKALTYRFKYLAPNSCCDSEGLALLRTAQAETSGSNWTVQDRNYLLRKEGVEWVKRDHYGKWIPKLSDPSYYLQQVELVEEEELLQYNVFSRSQPSIAADGDELFLVWVWDDPNRDPCEPNSLNRTQVRFSKYENGSWCDPCTIWDNNTADFSPQIATFDNGTGTALCVWEDVNGTTSDANLTNMAAAMDIVAAYYNGNEWQQRKYLTGNGHLDRSPRLAANGNKAIAVWISNDQNDLGIDPCSYAGAKNDICSRRWDGNGWQPPTAVANDQGLIVKTTLAYNGNQAIYVYEVDNIDANLGTNYDRELYAVLYDGADWSDPCQLTNDNVPDTNPQVMYEKNGDILLVWCRPVWFTEVNPDPNTDPNMIHTLIYRADVSVVGSKINGLENDAPAIPPAAVAALSGIVDFRLAKSDDDRVSLVWTDWTKSYANRNGIDIFTATRDPCLGLWSLPYQLTSDRAMEHSLAVTYAGSGGLAQLILAYDKVQIDVNVMQIYDDYFLDSNDPFPPHPYEIAKPEPSRVDLCLLKRGLRRDVAVGPEDIFIYLNKADVTFDWKVDFADVAKFADNWCRADCNEYNFWCYDCDFDRSGLVDYSDLAFLCQSWLRYSGGANPPPGSTVDVIAVVHNVGDYAEVNVPVVFEFSSSGFNNDIVYWDSLGTNIPGPILPGDSGMAIMEWTVPPIVVSPPHVRVSIEPDFRIQGTEDDSSDNQSSNELSAPDLTVTQVSVKKVDPNLGLTARISNIGGVRADDVNVVVCYGQQGEPNYNEHIASFRLSLDADTFYDIRHIWDPSGAPSNKIFVYVTADPNGTIDEFDEDNNMDFMLVRRG